MNELFWIGTKILLWSLVNKAPAEINRTMKRFFWYKNRPIKSFLVQKSPNEKFFSTRIYHRKVVQYINPSVTKSRLINK